MIADIGKFLLKFLLFSLVWTYGGRFIGAIWLIAWILISIFKKKK